METKFCFRVDIDTWGGIHKGLPRCIELAKEYSLPITYYLSLGEYATGKNIFRIVKNKETIRGKIPVWKRNYWKDLFRGVLLPTKKIDEKTKFKLQEYESKEFSEFHPHGFNHVAWSRDFDKFNEYKTSEYLDSAIEEYTKIFNYKPKANAAPNFVINRFYLKMLPQKKFEFASDFIYHEPFYLTIDSSENQQFKSIVQLPVTEETIENLVIKGRNKSQIVEFYKKRFQEQIDRGSTYICMYSHAIYEPIKLQNIVEEIFKLVIKLDIEPLTHYEYYEQRKKLPTIDINSIKQERKT